MTARPCRITGCTKTAEHHRTVCRMHRSRIRRHGDPGFSQWGTADPDDVELAASDRILLPGMTRLERIQLGLKLTAARTSAAEIARIVGVTPRTIHRWRAADRNAA
jgi:hypothetical protein